MHQALELRAERDRLREQGETGALVGDERVEASVNLFDSEDRKVEGGMRLM